MGVEYTVVKHSSSANGDAEAAAYQECMDHKDSINRYFKGGPQYEYYGKDHYLRPSDGKLRVLRVQRASNATVDGPTSRTWLPRRHRNPFLVVWHAVRNISRNILLWTFAEWVRSQQAVMTPAYESSPAWRTLLWKYPCAALGLLFVGFLGSYESDETRPGGKYPQVRYRYFGYPKLSRNLKENPKETQELIDKTYDEPDRRDLPVHLRPNEEDGVFARHLRPRFLCVVDKEDMPSPVQIDDGWIKTRREDYNVVDVDEWDKLRRDKGKGNGEYIFVSYTRAQFQTYTKEAMDQWGPPKNVEEENLRKAKASLFKQDLSNLWNIGLEAAREARVPAFWIDVLGMDLDVFEQDAHRICDVARGANRIVIALKDDVESRIKHPEMRPAHIDELLQVWSSRLWTLPELLLGPTAHDFALYRCHATEISYVETVPKRNMAERAYLEDGHLIRQLVDHFESNVHLTQIELLTLGLKCLMERETKVYMPADPIYALMTLARRRPHPINKESKFEAFAKLSLLNDSDMLLERLICLLNPVRGSPWHNLDDFWKAKLWDISPTCQVSGIDENQTVTLDGAYGASIEWGGVKKVGFLKRKTLWRLVGQCIIFSTPFWLFLGIALLAIGSEYYSAPGAIILIIALILAGLTPWVLLGLYRGKFWETEALLFGFEGVPDRGQLEEKLFGFDENRLQWSPYSSTQSLHQLKRKGKHLDKECESMQPSTMEMPKFAGSEERGPPEQARLFTIVDTYTMQLTTFWAVHPPSVALICGHEGGMRRALLCSYDYESQTFHRETVLRMPTKVLNRMDRVERFRFSLEPRILSTGLLKRVEF